MKTLAERYWNKVDRREEGCWGWHGLKDRHGYGQIRVNDKLVVASRIAWELAKGPIPDNVNVLHKCDNPGCTRIEHLFLGTRKDNSKDMIAKGRGGGQYKREGDSNACKRGHLRISGERRCRICTRLHHQAFKKRRIAQRPPKRCPICDTPFSHFGVRVYCSNKCKWTASNRKRLPLQNQTG